jgi:hypothetical protein
LRLLHICLMVLHENATAICRAQVDERRWMCKCRSNVWPCNMSRCKSNVYVCTLTTTVFSLEATRQNIAASATVVSRRLQTLVKLLCVL